MTDEKIIARISKSSFRGLTLREVPLLLLWSPFTYGYSM